MAEVVGLVSAGVGLAAFVLQVADKIDRLKSLRKFNTGKAEEELEFLIQRLEMLRANPLFLEAVQRPGAVDLAVSNCQLAYSSLDIILQRVSGRLVHLNEGKWKTGSYSGAIKEELRQARERVDSVINDLTFSCLVAYTHVPSSRPTDTDAITASSQVDGPLLVDCPTNQSTVATCGSLSDSSSATKAVVQSPGGVLPRQRPTDCAVKHCHCSCHLAKRSSGTLWALEYTPLSMFSRACNNPGCTATRYRWSLQFALTKYGIPLRIQAALEFIAGSGRYALRPALVIERVVRYTSPGFEALWLFQQGLISLSETKEKFRELNKIDPSLKQHTHPGGRNYVQELLHYGPSMIIDQACQFKLLEFFVRELDMNLENENERFLVRCANWIGEGRHLDLLETILDYGFDPGCIESPLYEDWPARCSPNWSSEQFTPDPFFIEYLAILVKASPGFAGSTPLHDIVLLGSPAFLASFLSRTSLNMEKNFLGQTPLHLGVRDVEIVRLLVEAGHDIDITDSQGITALLYAAAMGKTDVVQLLITQGANTLMQDLTWKRNFIAYAAARGNWELIMDALGTIQACYPPKAFQYFVTCALIRLLHCENWLKGTWSTYFARLIALLADTNIRFLDSHYDTADNNLLHYVSSEKDASTLVRHGFRLFNQPNSEGKTAIYTLSRILDSKLTRFLIDHGTDINVVDQKGHTVLFSLLRHLSTLDFRAWDIMDSIRMCLQERLRICSSDSCRCPCSPEGCSLAAAFHTSFRASIIIGAPSFVWALELLSLVEETMGPEDSKKLLLGFMRRMKSDQLGLTHVCCHRGQGLPWDLFEPAVIPDEDVDDILDEEEEFISELEREMLTLASEPLESLKSKWMVMLRDRYCEESEAYRKRNKNYELHQTKRNRYEVDYKNDTYHICFDSDFNFGPSVSHPMAAYIVWLEHQYSRSIDSGDSRCHRNAWYSKRLTWIFALMQVMQVHAETMVNNIIKTIEFRSWEAPGNPDKDRIVEHFMASMKLAASS